MKAVASLLAAVLVASNAYANKSCLKNDSGVTLKRHLPVVLFQSGSTSILVESGNPPITRLPKALTPLFPAQTINCPTASGCLLLTSLFLKDGGLAACAYIDGMQAEQPETKAYGGSEPITSLQRQLVSQGDHTVQIKLYSSTDEGGFGGEWEVNYELFQ